jgi:beta-mannosidase
MNDKTKLKLDGKWKLFYFKTGEYNLNSPKDLEISGLKHVEAYVPGNVELDLLRSGEIRDPFKGENIYGLKKYETYEWWYEKEFNAPDIAEGDSIELVFHGVDCFATYWLNGVLIGESDNALVEHGFDIFDNLNNNDMNKLTVRLRSPVIEAMKCEYHPYMSAFPSNWEHLWVRKAPHCYGWDIMPRAISAGLWRSVEINVHKENHINDLYFVTREINDSLAKAAVYYNIAAMPEYFGKSRIVIEGECEKHSFKCESLVRFSSGVVEFVIDEPMLWWPKGYGEPKLYNIKTKLVHEGKTVDEKSFKTGIRKVELVRSNPGKGENKDEFLFKINNTRIMCKGSNWVPADAFHSRDAGRYERMLELFNDLNCNMIRCWGGNVYEDHAFFDFCDKNGIMVWQDFAMACAAYPQDEKFFRAIEKEAAAVVKKLRNHPSIVLWCGDNECDFNYLFRGMDPGKNKITREILPKAIFKNDPYRPFYTSSPYFTPEIVQQKGSSGKYFTTEAHLWGPRDYYKSSFYTESKARFIGEIGYHGCPNLSSIKKFIDKEYLWPWKDNQQWITHGTSSEGKGGAFSYRIDLMASQIKEMFGVIPDNLQEFVIASQISQAEAKKFFIEMSRIKKWDRTGVLWWNVIDGWPQFSDAIVDYYFGKKLAYYYIKRVQQPVCVIIDEPENWNVRVVACNDTLRDADIDCRIWDADTGETLFKGRKNTRANENTLMGNMRVSRGEKRLFLIEWGVNGEKYANHYLQGQPPFSLKQYTEWLDRIALLDNSFDATVVGK